MNDYNGNNRNNRNNRNKNDKNGLNIDNKPKKINKNNFLLGVANNNSEISNYGENDIVQFLSEFESNNNTSSNLPQYNKGSTNQINQIQKSYSNANQRMNIQQNTKRNNLMSQLKKIEMNIRNSNNTDSKKSKNVLLNLIKKMENEIEEVNTKIKNFKQEKKNIVELNSKQINDLKVIVKKLYIVILKIYKSFELNKNQRLKLLNSIKNNVDKNNGFLKSINKLLNEKGNYYRFDIVDRLKNHHLYMSILDNYKTLREKFLKVEIRRQKLLKIK